MPEIAPKETIQLLEKRQDDLIVEIDALNGRLEQVLNHLAKPASIADRDESQ